MNAPKGYTVQQVENIYMDLYDQGAKTGTVYVDGSRDEQVLSLAPTENQFDDHKVTAHAIETDQPEEVESDSELTTPPLATKEPCYVCNLGELEVTAGCHTCNRCGAQQKCSL